MADTGTPSFLHSTCSAVVVLTDSDTVTVHVSLMLLPAGGVLVMVVFTATLDVGSDTVRFSYPEPDSEPDAAVEVLFCSLVTSPLVIFTTTAGCGTVCVYNKIININRHLYIAVVCNKLLS